MSFMNILKLPKSVRRDFYKSKYLYYKKFNVFALSAFCFTFIILFTADLANGFKWTYLFPRLPVLLPLAIFILIYKKTNSYRIMTTLSFIFVHAIIWHSIWIISKTTDMAHINENFLFMSFPLLIVSFCASPREAFIGQWGLLPDILLANRIFHFPNPDVLIVYICQVVVMLNIISVIVTRLYYDHYNDEKKLKKLSYYDPLTKVYNRNKLNELEVECSASNHCASVLVIDIDFFKKINDTFGHDKGDYILQFIAGRIKNSVREDDKVIRYGGEEFVVIMPHCSLKKALVIAERIRKDIEDSDNGLQKITVSIGVAEHSGDDINVSIKKADEALYSAKQSGRNKVLSQQ